MPTEWMMPFDCITLAISTFPGRAAFVVDPYVVTDQIGRQCVSADGLHVVAAAMGLSVFDHVLSTEFSDDDMRGEYLRQLVLVFRLEQALYRAFGQHAERRIRRCENREWPFGIDSVDKADRLHSCNQRSVICGVDGMLNDGFFWRHQCATRHPIARIAHNKSWYRERSSAGQNGYRSKSGFQHFENILFFLC